MLRFFSSRYCWAHSLRPINWSAASECLQECRGLQQLVEESDKKVSAHVGVEQQPSQLWRLWVTFSSAGAAAVRSLDQRTRMLRFCPASRGFTIRWPQLLGKKSYARRGGWCAVAVAFFLWAALRIRVRCSGSILLVYHSSSSCSCSTRTHSTNTSRFLTILDMILLGCVGTLVNKMQLCSTRCKSMQYIQ